MSLKVQSFPVTKLQSFNGNPRRGDISAIAESLAKRGQYRPIVVNVGSHTGRPFEILAGNHTWLAAKSLGWESIEATTVDVNSDEAAQIVLADNRLADRGSYDETALVELLESLSDYEGTGYSSDDVLGLLADLDERASLTDPDDVQSVDLVPSVCQVGQVWDLGSSKLVVGSCTDYDLVSSAFSDGVVANCVWTDPPYGVNYVGRTKKELTIKNDSADGLDQLLASAFEVVSRVSQPGAPVYVAYADTARSTFETALHGAGIVTRQTLIWVKNTLVMGRADYHYRHEPIAYGFTPGGVGRLGRGGKRWFGDDKSSTVFEVNKPNRNKDHPTMKPVELIEAMIHNSCPVGGLVFDPFGGSGSTLIAAYRQHMNAVIVELDPRYADVICRRFEEHTGIVPVLNDQPVTFIESV